MFTENLKYRNEVHEASPDERESRLFITMKSICRLNCCWLKFISSRRRKPRRKRTRTRGRGRRRRSQSLSPGDAGGGASCPPLQLLQAEPLVLLVPGGSPGALSGVDGVDEVHVVFVRLVERPGGRDITLFFKPKFMIQLQDTNHFKKSPTNQ